MPVTKLGLSATPVSNNTFVAKTAAVVAPVVPPATLAPYKIGLASGDDFLPLTSTYKLKVSVKKLGKSVRVLGGQSRFDRVAIKKEFKFAYPIIEQDSTLTWDGGLGHDEIKALCDAGVDLTLLEPVNHSELVYIERTVRFDVDFKSSVLKRLPAYYYKLDFTLIEV